MPDPLKTVIYRVLQEALNNIAKHSRADLVHLNLSRRGETIELIVRDNGIGFDPQGTLARENHDRGFGLSRMRERTDLSCGSFAIESAKGTGTTIRASWSCRAE